MSRRFKNKVRKQHFNKKINLELSHYYEADQYYIIASKGFFMTKEQMSSCDRVFSYYIRRSKRHVSKMVAFSLPITKKSKFSRMGSGKGKIKYKVGKVNMQGIMFIFNDVKLEIMYKVLKALQRRIPVKLHLKYDLDN
jgi:ribosomal protein L16/L10AE